MQQNRVERKLKFEFKGRVFQPGDIIFSFSTITRQILLFEIKELEQQLEQQARTKQ